MTIKNTTSLLVVAVLAGCGGHDSSGSSTSSAAPATSGSSGAPAAPTSSAPPATTPIPPGTPPSGVPLPPTPPPPATAWVELAGSGSGGGLSNTPADSLFPAVAVNATGTSPVVAWVERVGGVSQIYVRRWSGTRWEELAGSASGGGISNTGGASGQPAVAVDGQGRVVVAWWEFVNRTGQIYLKRWSGAAWEQLAGSATAGGLSNGTGADHAERPTLALDPNGDPVVAWEQRFPWPLANIYLKRWTGNGWVELGGSASLNGLSNTTARNSQMPSLEVDAAGYPVVAWLEGAPGSREVHLKRWDGATWSALGGSAIAGGVSGPTLEDSPPPLALDAAGHPTVCWSTQDATQTWQIFLKRWSGAAWVDLAGSGRDRGLSATPGASRSPDLVLDPTLGHPVVVWHDSSGPNQGWSTYLRRWNGAAWEELAGSATGQGVSGGLSGSSQLPRLATDVYGRPVAVWERGINGNLEVYLRAFR